MSRASRHPGIEAIEQLVAGAAASLVGNGEAQLLADLKFDAQTLAAIRTRITGEPLA